MPVSNGVFWKKTLRSTAGSFVLAETGETFASENELNQKQMEYHERKWKCRHEENGPVRSFHEAYEEELKMLDKIRRRTSDVLLHEIFQLVHHSSGTKEQLVEEIYERLSKNFYENENVSFIHCERQYNGRILQGLQSCCSGVSSEEQENEKRYDIETTSDGVKAVIHGVLSRNIQRITTISPDDISILISLIAQKTSGTSLWSLEEAIRCEFNISNKVHSLFTKCQPSSSKPNRGLTTSDKENNITKCSTGLRFNSSAALKRQSISVTQRKEGFKQLIKRGKKTIMKKKVVSSQSELEERKLRHLSKDSSSASGLQKSMYKFLLTSPGTCSPNVVALSTKSVAEKRLENALLRIVKLFPAPDLKEFRQACDFALGVLSEDQIQAIPYEEIRYAIFKQRDRKNEIALSAKMSRQEKKEFLLKKKRERAITYADIERKLSILLSKKLDDQFLNTVKPLPELTPIEFGELSPLFGSCLLITEFLNIFQSILVPEYIPSAEQLMNALKTGAEGSRFVLPFAITFMNTLLQSTDIKRYKVFGVPLSSIPVTVSTVSELVRIVLRDSLSRLEFDIEDEEIGNKTVASPLYATTLVRTEAIFQQRLAALEKLSVCAITELTSREQIEVLTGLVECVQDSSVFRSFVTHTITNRLKSLSMRKENLETTLLELEGELNSLPSFSHRSGEELSRHQAIIENKCERDRKGIERRLESTKMELDFLLEEEKECVITSKKIVRLEPLGFDRFYRRYWFFGKSPNRGIYVEKGWFNHSTTDTSEVKINDSGGKQRGALNNQQGTTSLKKTNSVEKIKSVNETPKKNKNDRLFEIFRKLYVGESTFPSKCESEKWYKISDGKTLHKLTTLLAQKGTRESKLLASIRSMSQEITLSMEIRSKEPGLNTKEESDIVHVRMYLHEEIRSFESELRKRRFTKINDENDFLERIGKSHTIAQLKTLLLELCESIPDRDYVTKQSLSAVTFSLPIWRIYLQQATSISQLSVLLHVLESQINWDYSLRGKRCRICNIGRYQDELIVCEECGSVTHLFCVRPKLHVMPPGGLFVCGNCQEENENDVEEESEMEEDSYSDSFVSSKQDPEEEEENHFRSERFTFAQKNALKYFQRLRDNHQTYKWLLKVPATESNSYRSSNVTLKSIQENLLLYTSEYKLKSDLRRLFKAASVFYQNDKSKQKRFDVVKQRLNL